MPLGSVATTNGLSGLLQKGLFEEEANRNLEAAAQAYSTVSAQFDKDRKLAATAIFRLGEIYRKQGKTNEAAGQYDRIVREFADQDTLVTLSRQNIAGMETSASKLSRKLIPERPPTGDSTTLESLGLELALLKAQLEQARKETNALFVARLFSVPTTEVGLFGELNKEALPKLLAYQELRVRTMESAISQALNEIGTKGANNNATEVTTDDEEKEIRRIQAMIQNSPDLINAARGEEGTPLYQAASKDQLQIAKFLLDHGAAINAPNGVGGKIWSGWPPLIGAANGGHKAMVELLLARGADVNARDAQGLSALHQAARRGFKAVIEVLLDQRADVNARDRNEATPLHLAMIASPSAVKALLDANAEAWPGSTLLFRAVLDGQAAAMELLLAHGAKPDVRSDGKLTPLSAAIQKNCLACAEALLAAKADANARLEDNSTPLHAAVNSGSKEMVALLIAHGADVNATANTGWTPLHLAASAGKKDLLELLLVKGANSNIRTKDGSTPLDLAQAQRRTLLPATATLESRRALRDEIVALLHQHGALDDLPHLDRIEVRRPSANFSAIAFQMGTNGWNEFRLLELIALHYGLISTEQNAVSGVNNWEMSGFWRSVACQFPDLGHVVIRRPASAGPQRTEVAVNVAELLDSGDCAWDVKLKPGDIIEIPEADHPVNEPWAGLGGPQLSNLLHCVSRTVTIFIKGTPTTIRLAPEFKPTNMYGSDAKPMQALTRGSFMLKSVLAQSRLLRASSDLSRIKVTRRAEAGGQKQEWLLNCGSGNDLDLWLRDGDVIEVPDKPQ